MRDPERIDPFLQRLGELWKRYPDYRFGQLIMNLIRNPCDNLEFQDPWGWENEQWEDRISSYDVPEVTEEELIRRAEELLKDL